MADSSSAEAKARETSPPTKDACEGRGINEALIPFFKGMHMGRAGAWDVGAVGKEGSQGVDALAQTALVVGHSVFHGLHRGQASVRGGETRGERGGQVDAASVRPASAVGYGVGQVARAGWVQSTARGVKEQSFYERAKAIGLCGPLGKRRADEWDEQSGADGRGTGARLVDELRGRCQKRLSQGWNVGKLGTALAWFEEFRRDTSRVPFVPLASAGDLSAAAYNAETLELFAEYMKLRGSKAPGRAGKEISVDYIQSVVSSVRSMRSSESHYGVVLPDADIILSKLYKEMRREQGPPGERKESRGFRMQHFRYIVRTGMRHIFSNTEWTLGLTAHNLVLRGGEIGRTDSRGHDPARDLTLASVDLEEPSPESRGKPWLTGWVVSIKDVNQTTRAVPLQMRQRDDPSDQCCAYTALAGHLARRWGQVPQCAHACAWCKRQPGSPRPGGTPPATCARANTPLFQKVDGQPYATEDVRALGRVFAGAAGIPPAAVGGKLWRIGGATDYLEVLGAQGERVLKARGRWGSDVAFVYARANARDMLDASVRVADADAREIEAVTTGWVQPATFR